MDGRGQLKQNNSSFDIMSSQLSFLPSSSRRYSSFDPLSSQLSFFSPSSSRRNSSFFDPMLSEVSVVLSAATDPSVVDPSVVEAPTVGLFNILPPQLLRRSKGEVKITNTNLQKDSSNEPIEVLLSTITPMYNKKLSNIFPELFTVIDKIYDKIVSCPDLNKQNDEILDLIKMVQDKTADLER